MKGGGSKQRRPRGPSTSGVARGGLGGFNDPIEKCQKISEDKIVENTQS